MSKEKTFYNHDEIFKFLFKETIFIDPISKIIENLENDYYTTKDIKFLENELKKFKLSAVNVLNMNFNLKLPKPILDRDLKNAEFNDLKDKYLYYFKGLLELFKKQL